jgi:hypothetical protein
MKTSSSTQLVPGRFSAWRVTCLPPCILQKRFRIFFSYRARGQILLVIAEIFLLATVDPCPRDGNSFAVAPRSSQRDWEGEGTGPQDEHHPIRGHFAEFKRRPSFPLVGPWLRKQVPALLIVKNPHLADDGEGFSRGPQQI